MTLTPDDLQNLAVVLKGGQDRTNSGILDALMKVAVGVCTAGVLWLLNTTTTVSTNVATMQAQQQSQNATLSEDISELKEAAKLPRVTKEDLTLVLEPMGQWLTNAESELRQQREVIAGVDKRLNQSENEISIIKLSIPEERAQ
jgi:hypothetical protein